LRNQNKVATAWMRGISNLKKKSSRNPKPLRPKMQRGDSVQQLVCKPTGNGRRRQEGEERDHRSHATSCALSEKKSNIWDKRKQQNQQREKEKEKVGRLT